MQPMQAQSGIQYGPQELEFYQQLFAIASPDGRDALDQHVAANFLAASHLPQDLLHQIWHFATSMQSYTQEYLTSEGFFVACRLVAWAQNGGTPLDAVHCHQAPPLLPEFPGLQRPPSSLGSRPHSVHSEVSELQPAILASSQAARRSPRSFTADRWAPSRRERRKYASLFKRTDWDQDGFVQMSEAWGLLERSRLDQAILQQIWDLSDVSRDGKLDFVEFVCLVHLVTCQLRGAQLGPSLAPQLLQALQQMEPLELLASEREQSRSRSASPAPQTPPLQPLEALEMGGAPMGGAPLGGCMGDLGEFQSAFPQDFGEFGNFETDFEKKDNSKETFEGLQDGRGLPDGQDGLQDFGADFGGFQDLPGDFGGFQAQGGAPDEAFGGDWPEKKGKKDKKKEKKKDKKDKEHEQDKEHQEMEKAPEGDAFGAFDAFTWEKEQKDPPDFPEPFPDPFRTSDFDELHMLPANEQAKHLHTVASTDRALARQLRQEVDQLDKDLRGLQELDVKLEEMHLQDTKELERLHVRRLAVERDLEDGKQLLLQLRDARSIANQESLSLRRDRNHLAEELRFLRHMAEEEEELIQVLQNSNQYLESSCAGLVANAQMLTKIHTDLVAQISAEKEQMQREKQQCLDLKATVSDLHTTEPRPPAKAVAVAKPKAVILQREGV